MNGQLVRNALYQHIVGKLNRLRALFLDIVFFAGSRMVVVGDEDMGPLAGISADVNGLDAAAFDFDNDHWRFAFRGERAPGFGRGGFHGRNGRMGLGREISRG
jgi:hypothetical protein